MNQALVVSIRVRGPLARIDLVPRPSHDVERRYFVYILTHELARLLDADPTRIEVVTLSDVASVVSVAIVFKPVQGDSSKERSPMGLISLLRALQRDTSSMLYRSSVLKYIDRDSQPPPVAVKSCPGGSYGVVCPYLQASITTSSAVTRLICGVLGIVAAFTLLFFTAWNIDAEKRESVDDDTLLKLGSDPLALDPSLREEYARSWLEGRLLGEGWQKAREANFVSF